MKAYVMDSFSDKVFFGNQAGVVLLDRELSDEQMLHIAAEFKHSETAFIYPRNSGESSVKVRFFTPTGEVELCGHATIASFMLLRKKCIINNGNFTAETKAGSLKILVDDKKVWMEMAKPQLIKTLDEWETAAIYSAFGLTAEDGMPGFPPQIVSTGLSDIIMPVGSKETLLGAVQNEAAVSALSKELGCVGVHMFTLGNGACTAFCSNFAPLCGINEECATGTANGALTYYLYLKGLIEPERENSFIQGEHMQRLSTVLSRLTRSGEEVSISIGVSAVMSMECEIKI